MDKSADAFRTISEVAEHLETPAHVLRFWESRFPQIRPVKRAGGRRYYRPSDVALLTGIKRLLHDDGMTIRGVQKILREQGVRHVAGLFDGAAANDFDGDISGDIGGDQIEGAVVQLRPQPKPEPAVEDLTPPALADKLAERSLADMDASGRSVQPAPVIEAAQGALLLTPAPVRAPSPVIDPVYGQQDLDSDQDAAGSGADQQSGNLLDAEPLMPVPDAKPAAMTVGDRQDDDDDFDDDVAPTLATRIRSLPPGASATKVGAELTAVVARLRALRDAMADAAHSDRG